MEEDETVPPQSPERALTPTIGFDYDYTMDEPPVIQRITEAPRHSTLNPEPPTLSARPRPASQPPRPRASSVPPTPKAAKRIALRYQPVTEEITPPITPPRAHAVEQIVDQDTPSPVQKPGRSRGHGTWRAPQKIAPGVGTRSKTRQAELEQIEAKQAQAACAECQMDENQNQNFSQPPAAGLMTQHQDVFFIPPPRVVGGARGISAPVSMATLGLIHRHDPSLVAQLREDPSSMASRSTVSTARCASFVLACWANLLPSNNGKRRCIVKMNNRH